MMGRRAPRPVSSPRGGLGVLAAMMLCALGCAGVRMAVPPEIAADSDLLEVGGRSAWGSFANESFRLGPYQVKDVDRKWDFSSGWAVPAFSRENTTGGYTYRFVVGDSALVGKCGTEDRASKIEIGSNVHLGFTSAKVGCSCEDGGSVSTLVVGGRGNASSGQLTIDEGTYAVAALHDLENGVPQTQPAGYRVDGERPVGAVQVLFPGRVWLNQELSPAQRSQAACLFAGLLLYRPPGGGN